MVWKFSNDAPVYAQLVQQIKVGIVTGDFPPGGRLPSVRELATEAGVNPNTMQKALAELERGGLVYSQRTAGRYVTEDGSMVNEVKQKLAQQYIGTFFDAMHGLGYGQDEIVSLLQQEAEKEGEHDDSSGV